MGSQIAWWEHQKDGGLQQQNHGQCMKRALLSSIDPTASKTAFIIPLMHSRKPNKLYAFSIFPSTMNTPLFLLLSFHLRRHHPLHSLQPLLGFDIRMCVVCFTVCVVFLLFVFLLIACMCRFLCIFVYACVCRCVLCMCVCVCVFV